MSKTPVNLSIKQKIWQDYQRFCIGKETPSEQVEKFMKREVDKDA